MEVPDIHVRVLFDFEYTTKEGKEVKIKEGEKLYLIKKTNEDWWQVIRNSGRPFYVPASYIEEIPRTNTWSKNEPKFNDGLAKSPSQIFQNNYRARSCSVESQQMHYNHKMKPVIPKRTIFDSKLSQPQDFELLPSLRVEDDAEDEEADYVNIIKQVDDTNFAFNLQYRDSDNSLSIANNVDRLLENISNNLMTAEDGFTNGYSHVTVKSCSLSPLNNEMDISLSNSLEELNQEIEQKAKSIGNVKPNSGYSKIDLVKSIKKDIPVSAKNISDSRYSGLKQINELQFKDNEGSKNRLQYSGSFKTKHEREKWAKNYALSSMREEECLVDDKEKTVGVATIHDVNDDNNNLNSNKPNSDDLSDSCHVGVDSSSDISKSDNSDILKSDKSVSEEAKVSSLPNEKTDFLIPRSSIGDSKFAQGAYFDSSTEDLERNSVFASSQLNASDKGSTDSLLDVDTHFSIHDGSICTTASDSLLHTSDTSEECLSSILREEPTQDENQKRKKPALKRNSRVECHRSRFPIRGISPPVPEENQQPSRELFGGWCEFTFTDGRTFFYNSKTGEKSWKPPRRRCNTDERNNKNSGSTSNLYSGSSSPLAEIDESFGKGFSEKENTGIVVPVGWRLETDAENGCQCFVNVTTGSKWFSSNDDEGRVYYFEENSSESSWTLPSTILTSFSEKLENQSDNHVYSNLPVITRSSSANNENAVTIPDANRNRAVKSKSLILMEIKNDETPTPFASKNWPQLLDGQMSVLKEGSLNRTKITENGKRLRKNWSSSHVVLTELLLLFFKDAKSFAAGISGPGRPEISVDLNGATIDKGDKVSSRKNVYIVSTVLGTQVLIQNDCSQQAQSWHNAILSVINNLPSVHDRCPRFNRGIVNAENVPVENESKKLYKVTRVKSVKAKNKEGSVEDLTVSPAERQTKIKARLKKFFHRRPTMESLVKKGIWKDEPAFGCYLDKVAGNETPRVPLFVRRCISCIERSEENMKTDGLYRASGNLSQVQKIRLQVDQNNLSVIEEEEDVHVLTGALKLFFRELKEPLIPYHLFHEAIKASHNQNKKEKVNQFREITKALPTVNYDTLKFLLQHLLRVTKYKEFNRMHIPNLAIVFGPTLMWPEQESNNMALDLMQQNLVIECLLVEYSNIFR